MKLQVQVLTALIAGVMASCTTSSNSSETPQEPTMKTIAKGPHSGLSKPVKEVIRTNDQWEKLWKARSDLQQPAEPAPAIDFHQTMVIAVASGQKPTGGYAIEVIDVDPQADHLRVEYAETTPPKGQMTIQVLTTPFHFVAVPKSDLDARFVEVPAETAKKPDPQDKPRTDLPPL